MKHKKTSRNDSKRDDRNDKHVIDHEEKRPIKNWTKVYIEYEPYAEDLEVFYTK